jgi:hypothetical protein
MKLLLCNSCGDLFNLDLHLKSCSCGKVKGKYIDRQNAVVNGEGQSIAIGNRSLDHAIFNALHLEDDPRQREYVDPWHHSASIMCWARPHEGPANPHTKVDKDVS